MVLIGGGHAHVEVLRQFAMHPVDGLRLTLISPQYETPYSGMLPRLIAGECTLGESHINLLRLCRFAGAQFYRDAVTGLDPEARTIHCRSRPPVALDFLSINIGSTPAMVPGVREHAVGVKPVDRFLERLEEMDRDLKEGARVMVAGGGAGGFEVMLALHARWKGRCAFTLCTMALLPTHNGRVRRHCRRVLESRGIELREDCRIERVDPDRVHVSGGGSLPCDHLVWATRASAPRWPGEAGLEVVHDGFVKVDASLRSLSHPFVFAAGDIAWRTGHPLARAGVHAVRQGPILAVNLRNAVLGRPLRRYRPRRRFLSLLGTADGRAVASRGSLFLSGRWVWRWKRRIDERFMRRYRDLPPMAKAGGDAPGEMRCAGCGSKVPQEILERVLRNLGVGGQGPEDASVVPVPAARFLVQSIDHLPAFLDDPHLSGRIIAIHAMNDILAMGARLHSAQAVAMVPWSHPRSCEESLFQLLSGAVEELRREGVRLLGGHSLEGEGFALGLAVTGLLDEEDPWRKGGLRVGDRLLLTKPLGTGMILAALMRGLCPGPWLSEAVDSMCRSHARAVPLFRKAGVRALTDCTGFGLAGHLGEMLRASGVDAELHVERVPVLAGARDCAVRGILSSLQPGNLLANQGMVEGAADHPVLFDPQTSGGLLAAVPAPEADRCLDGLRRQGWDRATLVGTILPRQGTAPRIRLVG